MTTAVTLRAATVEDLGALVAVHLASRRGAGPAFPVGVHSDAEVHAWVSGWDLADHDVWVAERAGRVVGYARCTLTWLDDLYLLPEVQGQGIGTALLDRVKQARPDGFGLWVFETNTVARAFYRARGFVELERTDGSANEEQSPDIKMVWPGHDPLACFRSMIDDVDLVLGDVLARRAALTRAVQAVKPSTRRDAAREEEIARRVAAVAPELGEERVARIVRVIITEALDAARRPT